jgi:Protein of unknown function (DUF4242)
MPRYLVERTFPTDQRMPASARAQPDSACNALIGSHAQAGVTWVHSYVTPDCRRSWCICDGPSPETIRAAARAGGLPVDRITEVRMVDPHVFR